MFCPECGAEFRTEFTECSQCAVELIEELPTEVAEADGAAPVVIKEPLWRTILAFLIHQFIATLGVMMSANVGLEFFADFVSPLGWILSAQRRWEILGQTHYFPVQVTLALLTGWTLGRSFPRRSMYRVWILPLVTLLIGLMVYRAFHPSVFDLSPFTYFFGTGCDARFRCLDQIALTQPFYTTVAYSVGSWFAQTSSYRTGSEKTVHALNLWRTSLASFIVWLGLSLVYLSEMPARDIPLSVKVITVLISTVMLSTATTLLAAIGSGLVGSLRRAKAHSDGPD